MPRIQRLVERVLLKDSIKETKLTMELRWLTFTIIERLGWFGEIYFFWVLFDFFLRVISFGPLIINYSLDIILVKIK